MDPSNRQRLKILFILLAVLVATVWVGRTIYDVPEATPESSAGDLSVPEPGRAESLATEGIDFDRLSVRSVPDDGPGRNPFQFGPESSPPSSQSDVPLPLVPEPGAVSRPPAVVEAPSAPPPPPIPFQYNGYAVVDLSGETTALLFDSERSFVVSAQDVVVGRYRIIEITEAFVEIEDLEFGPRQRLPLITQ